MFEPPCQIYSVVCYIKYGVNAIQKILAVLDTGSNCTMIDKEFAQHLKLEPLGMPYTKSVSYVDRQVEYETTMVKVELVGQDTQFTYRLAAETVENFQQHCHLTNWSKEKEKFSYLQRISVPSSPEECTAAMLIGVDNSFLFRIQKLSQVVGQSP